jgi:hypothetical protein
MFYRLLGMAIWNGGKLFLRKKYGPTYVPKSLLAAGVLALAGGVVLLVTRRGDDD